MVFTPSASARSNLRCTARLMQASLQPNAFTVAVADDQFDVDKMMTLFACARTDTSYSRTTFIKLGAKHFPDRGFTQAFNCMLAHFKVQLLCLCCTKRTKNQQTNEWTSRIRRPHRKQQRPNRKRADCRIRLCATLALLVAVLVSCPLCCCAIEFAAQLIDYIEISFLILTFCRPAKYKSTPMHFFNFSINHKRRSNVVSIHWNRCEDFNGKCTENSKLYIVWLCDWNAFRKYLNCTFSSAVQSQVRTVHWPIFVFIKLFVGITSQTLFEDNNFGRGGD